MHRAAWMLLLALTSVTALAGEVVYDYDQAGRMRGVTYPDGTRRIYTLDPSGNRTQVQNALRRRRRRPAGRGHLFDTNQSFVDGRDGTVRHDAGGLSDLSQFGADRDVDRHDVQQHGSGSKHCVHVHSRGVQHSRWRVAAIQSHLRDDATGHDSADDAERAECDDGIGDSDQYQLDRLHDSGGSGLAGYKIFRKDAQIATATGTTCDGTGLTPSTLYRYKVAAYDNAGNTSALSNESSATRLRTRRLQLCRRD